MAVTIELLPLSTIEKADPTPVYQDTSDTIDTSRYTSAVIASRVLRLSDDETFVPVGSLQIEGSDDGQNFVPISGITVTHADVPTSKRVHLNRNVRPGDNEYLWRFLRWVVTPTPSSGDNLEFCGRVTVVLK